MNLSKPGRARRPRPATGTKPSMHNPPSDIETDDTRGFEPTRSRRVSFFDRLFLGTESRDGQAGGPGVLRRDLCVVFHQTDWGIHLRVAREYHRRLDLCHGDGAKPLNVLEQGSMELLQTRDPEGEQNAFSAGTSCPSISRRASTSLITAPSLSHRGTYENIRDTACVSTRARGCAEERDNVG